MRAGQQAVPAMPRVNAKPIEVSRNMGRPIAGCGAVMGFTSSVKVDRHLGARRRHSRRTQPRWVEGSTYRDAAYRTASCDLPDRERDQRPVRRHGRHRPQAQSSAFCAAPSRKVINTRSLVGRGARSPAAKSVGAVASPAVSPTGTISLESDNRGGRFEVRPAASHAKQNGSWILAAWPIQAIPTPARVTPRPVSAVLTAFGEHSTI